jgi:hypothetical protein
MIAALDLAPVEVAADPLTGVVAVLALPFNGFLRSQNILAVRPTGQISF